ncbi:MAG: hypothetical protein JRJ12_08790 [Deltaproteobacteria bacterium]|nr:hypothetical protein [Deltaproteobacteria bacterium]MBW2071929.1 hypothetical protein [Deltaproteobacteria bacterium]
MPKRQNEQKNDSRKKGDSCSCPFCLSQKIFHEKRSQYHEFFDHLQKARVEVLRAFKSLIDKRISELEKREKKRVVKVKIE